MSNKTYNYLFAEINLPPRKKDLPDYVFILWNPVCSFEFDRKTDDIITRVFDEKLYNPGKFKDSEEASARFNAVVWRLLEMRSNLVLMEFNIPLAMGLADAAKDIRRRWGSRWLALSFFHSDEDTLKLSPPAAEDYPDILEQKIDWIMAMNEVPFVKKVEIPLDMVITARDIRRWFKEYMN